MPTANRDTRRARPWTSCALLLSLALAIGGCAGSTAGVQLDASPQTDSGTPQVDGGGDGAVPDGGGGDGGGVAGHRGTAIMAGAVDARSTRYRAVMSTGQSPGGNNTAATSTYKVRGGLVGATQGR